MRTLPASLEPLRHKPFRWLAAARTVNFLGNAVAPIALAFAVLDLTGSATDLGLVVGARSLANVLLLLYGGVLADRLPRPVVLQGSALAAGLTQAVAAVLVLTGVATVPLLMVLGAVNGAVAAIAMPASSALTSQTVPGPVLRQANALLRMGLNGALICGAALGGVLVAAVGPGWGIAVDATTFLLSALCFSRLDVPRVVRAEGVAAGPVADLREGWGEFVARPWVWVVVLQFMVLNACFTGGVAVLGPAVADAHFGRRAWGLVLAAQTVGFVVGGLLALRWQPRRALALGVLLTGVNVIPLSLLGVDPRVPVLVLAMFVTGVAIEQFGIAWDVSLQEHVPPDRLARVYSYDALGSFLAIPVGQVVAGPLAAAVGVQRTLVGAAVLTGVATLLALCSRSVRSLERHAPPPPAVRDHAEQAAVY